MYTPHWITTCTTPMSWPISLATTPCMFLTDPRHWSWHQLSRANPRKTFYLRAQRTRQCKQIAMGSVAPCECKECLLERHPQLSNFLCTSTLVHKHGGRVCCCGKVHVAPPILCRHPRKKTQFPTSTLVSTKRSTSPQQQNAGPAPKKKFSVKDYAHLLESIED